MLLTRPSLEFEIKSDLDTKRKLIGSIFPKKFQFENKKVRTADINPILHKIARFNRLNRKNKKRDKSEKEDLSLCVHPIELFSKQTLELLNRFI